MSEILLETHIEKLNISKNKVGNEGILAIADIIKQGAAISYLKASHTNYNCKLHYFSGWLKEVL